MKNIRKRIIAGMTAAAMSVGMAAIVYAEDFDREYIKDISVSVSDIKDDIYIPDEAESFEGYFNKLFYPDRGMWALSGANAYSNLSVQEKKMYDSIKPYIESVASGRLASTQFPSFTVSWSAADLGLSTSASMQEAINTFNSQGILNTTVTRVFTAILADLPYELYWFNKSDDDSFGVTDLYVTYNGAGGVDLNMTVTMAVAPPYNNGSIYLVNTAKTSAASSAALNADLIAQEFASLSAGDQVRGFCRRICELVSYDNAAAAAGSPAAVGVDPWQMINVFDGDASTNVVCEGYSKAFKYLCDRNGIECYTVSGQMAGGTGAGGHMWNIVVIGGKSYLVDVTNCDSGSIGAPDQLCLKGSASYVNALTQFDVDTANGKVIYLYDDRIADLLGSSGVLDLAPSDYTGTDPSPVDPTPTPDPSDPNFDPTKVPTAADARAFASRIYTEFLKRDSANIDEEGLGNFTRILTQGYSASIVMQNFIYSPEITNQNLSNSEFVRRMYRTMLDRTPTDGEMAGWVTALDNGCSYGIILQGFIGAPEFTAQCSAKNINPGTYTSPENRDRNDLLTAYVNRMYRIVLGRTDEQMKAEVQGLNNHTGTYLTGQATPAGIAHGFFFSAEFTGRNVSNSEYVGVLYSAMFGRDAAPGEDAGWVNALESGGYTREDVFNGFTLSPEFAAMVSNFNI